MPGAESVCDFFLDTKIILKHIENTSHISLLARTTLNLTKRVGHKLNRSKVLTVSLLVYRCHSSFLVHLDVLVWCGREGCVGVGGV